MKKGFTYYVAMFVGKAMIHVMRMLKRNATNLPGEVALIICPKLISKFQMPENVIVVTGTNGKTTITNMIGTALKNIGHEPVMNAFGGNVDTGIANVLIENSDMNGKIRRDTVLIEMDERSAPRILPYLKPDYLICTNLQRDSMKRNPSTEFIFNIINENVPEKTTLILNADDLISSQLARQNKNRVYFGVNMLENEIPTDDNIICDLRNCPHCGAVMEFQYRHYNHIGHAVCPECGFTNYKSDYQVTVAGDGSLELMHNENTEVYPLPQDRITDIYNTASVVAFLRTFGLSEHETGKCLEHTGIIKSRYDSFTSHGKPVYVYLAKGQCPISCSNAFDTVRREDGRKTVIIIVEHAPDRQRTCENTAWTYETDFEFLNQEDIVQIIVGGKRAKDFLVRLLLAGVDRSRIDISLSESELVEKIKWDITDKLMILYHFHNTQSLLTIKQQLDEGGAA